jgi:hypothetical protein
MGRRLIKWVSLAFAFGACALPAANANELGPLGKKIMLLSGQGRNCPEVLYGDLPWTKPLKFTTTNEDGRTILTISGTFTAGDSDRLRTFLQSAGSIYEVRLDSGGGNAAEGPKVGSVIRSARLSTHILKGYACISSCSMAFLGGMLRTIDDGALYGLHTFFDDTMYDSTMALGSESSRRNFLHKQEQDGAILAGEVQQYGQRMGIARDFFTQVMFRQRSVLFITDARLMVIRREMSAVMTQDQAKAYVTALFKEGIVPLSTDDEISAANDLLQFLTQPHTLQEIDEKLSPFLQTFECISPYQLSKYNVTNVVRRN